ncbi:MAG: hypothetical protein C0621_11210 [Desulfuromonas sp.]|nr:MAG: hypothetical protein C0621_11210 [Desulfuromonas sp.]
MTTEKQPILVVDDEEGMRHMLRLVLERSGYVVETASSGEEALGLLEASAAELVLCDIRMPQMDGQTFLGEVQKRHLPVTLIMMSAYGNIDTAISCLRQGAYDYISKPFKPDEVLLTVKKAEERLRLARENRQLRAVLRRQEPNRPFLFASEAMAEIDRLLTRLAPSEAPVLVTGETGTGKELIARALHQRSPRSDAPFIAVNFSAISAGLLESELFGHQRGAFSGADRDHPGLFAAADGGTLFLDEIGELPLDLQPKLLRALQEKEIRRVGSTRPQRVDARVVAATARDLTQEVNAGRFRDDLFYRLAVLEVKLSPLRERRDDILPLAEHFLAAAARRQGRSEVPTLTNEAQEQLCQLDWPGNVRELENFIEKAVLLSAQAALDVADLPDARPKVPSHDHNGDFSLKRASRLLEEEYIRKALAATDGNRTQAAQLLEISLRSLLYKIKEYGI